MRVEATEDVMVVASAAERAQGTVQVNAQVRMEMM